MSTSFSDWYERMKSLVTGEAAPGEKTGADLDRCARQVMARGHDQETAYSIANTALKAGLEKSQRDDLLATAEEVSDYDGQVTQAFQNVVDYAGVDTKGEDDLELPKSCRRCESNTRMKGNFMCPDCHPDVDEKSDDYELVGTGVQEAAGAGADQGETEGDGEETEKADRDDGPEAARKVYLDNGIEDAPEDATVRSDEKGLYYEAPLEGTAEKGDDVDGDVDQKADPMANGHDLDPETGKGSCASTGKEIEAETMQELTEDCPHCGEALSVLSEKADSKAADPEGDAVDDVDQKADVDAVALVYPPGGEVIDHEEGDWEGFLDDLEERAGQPFQLWKGVQAHPEDALEAHDHATFVAGADPEDVQEVLEDHPAVRYEIADE